MRKFLVASLAAAVAVPVVAQSTAPVAPTPPAPPVARVAPMADKVVTRAEVDAMVRSHFARLDSNRDGFVAGEELNRGGKLRRGEHHGRQARAKAHRDPAAAFDRIDVNKDGMISRTEFSQGREAREARRGAFGGHRARMHMHRMGGMMDGRLLKLADADRDGRVSLVEATSGAARHFDTMDSNRDGRVTIEERRAGRMEMKQRRRGQPTG